MKNKIIILALGAMLFALSLSVEAQQPTKVPQIGPRQLSARRIFRGQNSQGRQACRSSCRAADEVRAGDQSESAEADWPDLSAECASARRQGDSVRRKRCLTRVIMRNHFFNLTSSTDQV
jgi:hypothetical protein